MDRITSARVFFEVANCASLTLAAQRLGMSPAMVSRHLAAAEVWLGARLLNRTTRRVSLTDVGQDALATCKQLLDLTYDLEHATRERRLEPQGTLRIATSGAFAEAQLAGAVLDFQKVHSKVRIELLVADRTLDLVEERIDLAVRITNSLDPNLISKPLAQCRSILCAAPAYLEQNGNPVTVDDLSAHVCVGHQHGGGTTYRLAKASQVFDIPIQWCLMTNETFVLRHAVLAGAGIGMLPTYFVSDAVRRGDLVHVLPDYEPETLGIYAVYLSRRHQPLTQRSFVDFLAARFGGGTTPWD
jgi:DNA-binding transcriptional LysR family regulator